MVTFVAATDDTSTSAPIADYLADRVTDADTVHIVNSLRGGDETDAEATRAGHNALDAVEADVESVAGTVETHQLVRGKSPSEDVLQFAEARDADEIVIGVRERNPTGKAVFGSTSQRILLNTSRPVVAVPR